MSISTVLLLGACTGDGSTGPTPPTGLGTFAYTPSPEPSPTETPAPETVHPDRPDAMDQDGVEGAEATARYFLELYPYVYATGDLEEWERLSHPECKFCVGVAEEVEQHVAAGEVAEGAQFLIDDLTVEQLDTNFVSLRIDADQAAGVVRRADGEVVAEYEPGPVRLAMAVTTVEGSWQVRGVEVLESEGT